MNERRAWSEGQDRSEDPSMGARLGFSLFAETVAEAALCHHSVYSDAACVFSSLYVCATLCVCTVLCVIVQFLYSGLFTLHHCKLDTWHGGCPLCANAGGARPAPYSPTNVHNLPGRTHIFTGLTSDGCGGPTTSQGHPQHPIRYQLSPRSDAFHIHLRSFSETFSSNFNIFVIVTQIQ